MGWMGWWVMLPIDPSSKSRWWVGWVILPIDPSSKFPWWVDGSYGSSDPSTHNGNLLDGLMGRWPHRPIEPSWDFLKKNDGWMGHAYPSSKNNFYFRFSRLIVSLAHPIRVCQACRHTLILRLESWHTLIWHTQNLDPVVKILGFRNVLNRFSKNEITGHRRSRQNFPPAASGKTKPEFSSLAHPGTP